MGTKKKSQTKSSFISKKKSPENCIYNELRLIEAYHTPFFVKEGWVLCDEFEIVSNQKLVSQAGLEPALTELQIRCVSTTH